MEVKRCRGMSTMVISQALTLFGHRTIDREQVDVIVRMQCAR